MQNWIRFFSERLEVAFSTWLISAIHKSMEISLTDTKELVASAPKTISTDADKKTAMYIKEMLEAQGAEVVISKAVENVIYKAVVGNY